MKKIKTYIVTLAIITLAVISAAVPLVASAATCDNPGGKSVETSVIDCPNSGRGIIWDVLSVAVNFLAAGVGLAVVAGIVFGAVTYATAAGSADQAKKGIGYVTNAVIALLLFVFMYAIINFLVPGGLF